MKRVLYVLGLGIFGIATTEFGVIGVLPPIASSFNIGMDKAGWLLSSFALIIALFGPLMTMLFSRMAKKKALLIVLVVFTISNVISYFAGSFPMLLLARILPAFLHPVFWSIALAIAAGSAPESESPKAVGIVFGGFTIASVLGVPLVTLVADVFDWRASFLLSAGINVASFIGLLALLPDLPVSPKGAVSGQMRVLTNKLLWARLILVCLMIAAMYASYGYLAGYLRSVTKMNGSQISLMLLIFGITGVGGNLLAGRMLSKSIPLTTICFIGLLLLLHILVFMAGADFIPMVIMVFIWGFIHTGGFLIGNVNVTSAAPGSPEFVNSIFTSCGNLAVTLGSTIGGLAIAHAGIHMVIWTSVALLIASFLVWIFIFKNTL